MQSVLEFMAASPAFLVFLIIGFGALLGHISIKKISLGAAAVLFLAIAVSAYASVHQVELAIPAEIGHIGLALFTFTVGVSSGASFFRSLRNSLGVMAGVLLAIVIVAVLVGLLSPLFNISGVAAIGVFAGAVTNTPALGAAEDHAEATVAYSICYLFGVLGMLAVQIYALRKHNGVPESIELIRKDIRVEKLSTPMTVAELESLFDGNIRLTRVRHEEDGPIELASQQQVIAVGDVVTAAGTKEWLNILVATLGHESSHHLQHDRSKLDSIRMTISSAVAGKRIHELELEERFGATITRIRRGDTHMVAGERFIVELGDSVLVVGPRERMNEIRSYLGDSTRSLTVVNAAAVGLGLSLGFLLGEIPLPLPGGGQFKAGAALCSLIVGLVFGRIGKIGSLRVKLPFTVTAVIAELGLLLFLAQTGVKAGAKLLGAFSSGSWLGMFVLGAIATLVYGLLNTWYQRQLFKMGPVRLAGLLAGAQTQPALLAYANDATSYDFRVSLGYTTAYPIAMVSKILVASLLAIFFQI